MTKKSTVSTFASEPEKAPRKLSKKEREEYERQLNEALAGVVDSIREGRIQAPWWRESQ